MISKKSSIIGKINQSKKSNFCHLKTIDWRKKLIREKEINQRKKLIGNKNEIFPE